MIKSKNLLMLMAALGMAVLSSCSQTKDSPQTSGNGAITDLNPLQFHNKMKSMEGAYTLIDVRTTKEYEQGHIEKAMLIDKNKPDFSHEVGKLDKELPVFVYCAVGGRSSDAVKVMKELGFKEIYHLKGGLMTYKQTIRKLEK